MSGNLKISIRFFNDREVRAVWDESHANQLVSVTTQLKLTATVGKKYNCDILDRLGSSCGRAGIKSAPKCSS